MTPSIKLSGASKYFGDHTAVDHVNLDVLPGECVALVGHNGAGKTTLFKMLLGLLSPSSGVVEVLGQAPSQSKKIGFLPESVIFQRAMTGLELLHFFSKLKNAPIENCPELLEQVGLDGVGHKAVGTYSKGMRQRLGLAQALIGSPDLLILDEPTSGLDPSSRRGFYRLLDEMRGNGTTIILSSHALTELEAYTSRVAIMKSGKLLAYGQLSDLAEKSNLPVSIDIQFSADKKDHILLQLKPYELAPLERDNWFRLTCPVQEKMHVLQRVTFLEGLVRNIKINEPTLDNVYEYFQQTKDGNSEVGGDL